MRSEIRYGTATEEQLNDLFEGRDPGIGLQWVDGARHYDRIPDGSVKVIWKEDKGPQSIVHPMVLVSRPEDHRRLCGRFAHVRSDFSPLTVWCHLLTPDRFESLSTLTREAELGGYEAAWSGLVIAEALLLAERPVSQIPIANCLGTQTFATARSLALWGSKTLIGEVLKRFDAAQRLFRSDEARAARMRTALQPIWESLVAAAAPEVMPTNDDWRAIAQSLRSLAKPRSDRRKIDFVEFSRPLSEVTPEGSALIGLEELPPEQRLQLFDRLVKRLDETEKEQNPRRRVVLAMLAGFLATVAAGGAPSLGLADATTARWPEITAWAYVIGGLGERILWTSAFDGLGRLVARELMRPLRLDEPPNSDVSLDEAQFLVDSQLKDPFVHLRLKSRVVSIALLPGVNVRMPVGGQELTKLEGNGHRREVSRGSIVEQRSDTNALAAIADALWPYLQSRLEHEHAVKSPPRPAAKAKRSRDRSAPQVGLPLKHHGN